MMTEGVLGEMLLPLSQRVDSRTQLSEINYKLEAIGNLPYVDLYRLECLDNNTKVYKNTVMLKYLVFSSKCFF